MTKMEAVKNHFQKYKTTYLVVGVAVLTAGITYLIVRNQSFSAAVHIAKERSGCAYSQISGIVDSSFSFGDHNVSNSYNTYVGNGHRMSKIISCDQTGEWFRSQAEAARYFGMRESNLSKHLNLGESIPGSSLTFTRQGVVA